MIERTRIVLVRPHYAGNIGAVARVMANFGLTDLVLVDPIANPLEHQARSMAAGGVSVLDRLRIQSWDEALADCTMVLATEGTVQGTLRETIAGTAAELLPGFARTLAYGPSAIVFGPEPHGLTTAELGRAHALLHLPSHPAYTSFNLSMAVGLTLAELWRATQSATPLLRPAAPYETTLRAVDHLEEAFRGIKFVFGQNGDHLMHGFRHMLLRALPTQAETGMLHGLAKQLEYIAQNWPGAETRSPPAK
jgi:TrmH family RNA methyltransferase